MNKFKINAVTVAVGLVFSAAVMAQNLSKEGYAAGKLDIAATSKSAIAACATLSGNAKDICRAGANGTENVAKADLEAQYKPSNENSYKVRIARADADYSVAKEKCDDRAGNVKDVCVKEAKAAEVTAKADAKTWMKTAAANDRAAATSTKANNKASDVSAEARKDAASDKRDADYAVAKEKCDAFASDAKSNCINEAKARFSKT
ncbi:MAG: hypothetical protein ABL891_10320 [Burkholderiales bacterium]